MWKKIKQTSSRAVEFVKQKGGKENEKTNPEYAEAVERYTDMKNHLLVFIDNCEKFIDPLSKTGLAVSDVSKNVERDAASLSTASEISKDFVQLSAAVSGSLDEKVIQKLKTEILAPLKTLNAKFNEYSKMKADHLALNLLLASNKDKLEKLQKTNKNPAKTQDYQNKVATKTEQLNQMEAQFISEINAQWANRFVSLHKPFVDLAGILFDFSSFACEASQSLQSSLGPDVMAKEFTQEAAPAK